MQVKRLRESKNMTQSEIALALGVNRTAVSMWETGDSMPRAELLPQLAKVLGGTIDELFGGGERAS